MASQAVMQHCQDQVKLMHVQSRAYMYLHESPYVCLWYANRSVLNTDTMQVLNIST